MLRNDAKSRRNHLARRLGLFLALLGAALLFGSLLQIQSQSLDPNLQRSSLISKGLSHELSSWNIDLKSCYKSAGLQRVCTSPANSAWEPPQSSTFPLVRPKESSTLKHNQLPNTGFATYTLSPDDRTWIAKHPTVVLMLVRSLQNSVRLITSQGDEWSHGAGATTSFSFHAEDLLKEKAIQLEFDFEGYDWFGPMDLPIALVVPDAVSTYESLPYRQMQSASLSRQMEIGIPVLLLGIALVLDHSAAFALLAFFGASYALRSYIPFRLEQGLSISSQLSDLYFAANGLVFALLVLLIAKLCDIKWFRKWRWLAFISGSILAFWSCRFVGSWFFLHIDSVADACASAVGIILVLTALPARLIQNSRTKKASVTTENKPTLFTVDLAGFALRSSLVLFGLTVHLYVNLSALLSQNEQTFRSILDWKHSALWLFLVIASLLEVGAISRLLLQVRREIEEKSKLDQELSLARKVQFEFLPARRGIFERYFWRSFFVPARSLAGDWFDIRILQFNDGRRLMAACVGDVTGHGIGSALTTAVLSSLWGLWCENIQRESSPQNREEREKLLISAPHYLHDGFAALRKNENAAAVIILIDQSSNELSYTCAAHPGLVLISQDAQLQFLFTHGSSVGGHHLETRSWEAKSQSIHSGDTVALFSDGLVPQGTSPSSWIRALSRQAKKTTENPQVTLVKEIRNTRTLYRANPAQEDDITLVFLGFT